jgi:hypothetical protein
MRFLRGWAGRAALLSGGGLDVGSSELIVERAVKTGNRLHNTGLYTPLASRTEAAMIVLAWVW